MTHLLDLIWSNKQWLFSGVGVIVLLKAPWAIRKIIAGVRSITAQCRSRRVRIDAADLRRMFEVMGESSLARLSCTVTDSTGKVIETAPKVTVELETPDSRQVWQVGVPIGWPASELALAGRAHFKLPAFYRLTNRARPGEIDPNASVTDYYREGDRLALIDNGAHVWGWTDRSRWPFRLFKRWRYRRA